MRRAVAACYTATRSLAVIQVLLYKRWLSKKKKYKAWFLILLKQAHSAAFLLAEDLDTGN